MSAVSAEGVGGGGERADRPAGVELARQALARAREDARQRGAATSRGTKGGRDYFGGRKRFTQRDGDPSPLSSAIEELLADRGWEAHAAVAGVFARWPEIVGPELSSRTRPESFAEGELTVVADSTAWATQVRLLAPALVRRLNEELGDGAVRRVRVRGPTAADRRPGTRRVSGRGPRDTYG